MTEYDKCKKIIMEKIIKEYEKGILKKAKSRKQAIAIGLSISENKCQNKFDMNDNIIKIENKIKKINNNEKISVSFIKDCVLLINYYKKNKKYKKANDLKNNIIKLILKDIIKNNKINKLILIKSLELF